MPKSHARRRIIFLTVNSLRPAPGTRAMLRAGAPSMVVKVYNMDWLKANGQVT